MSSPGKQLGPYLGDYKSIAKSLRKKGKRNAALGVLSAGVGKKPPRGVRVKTISPTSSRSSQYGSVQSGNAVIGPAGVYGFFNKRTGMVWSPNTRSWVPPPPPSMSAQILNAFKSTAESVRRRLKPDKSKQMSMARSIQSELSYDPAFGKKVRNLQNKIKKLENELKVANEAGDPPLVSRKRKQINNSKTDIIDLVNAESKRLSNVYKKLKLTFNTTPKNKLRSDPGALERMINKIMGTIPKVTFTKRRGPSTKTPAGIAAASARRFQSSLPNYGNLRGTGSATAARAGVRARGNKRPIIPRP